MIVRYDALDRFETPLLTLCNPGSVRQPDDTLTNVVGILTDVSDMEGVFNFNETSELNFRVNLVHRGDDEEDAHAYAMYRGVKNRRLIYAESIGYFTIVNIEEGKSVDGVYKDVKAQSIDMEIAQKMIPYIEDGTYKFYTASDGDIGLLNTIVATLPLWRIGNVDETVASKHRTFEDVDTSLNCLGFMLENMQDAYECIFIFDIINRVINVYSQDNYVVETNIHLTREDLIKNLDIREDADDLYTAITVRGSDEAVTIGAINPLGSNTIYDFTYYLSWMTPALGTRVREWQDIVAVQQVAYREKNLQYYEILNKASGLQQEMDRIASQITMYKRCRENIIAESNTDIVASYNAAIADIVQNVVAEDEDTGDDAVDISESDESEPVIQYDIITSDDVAETLASIDDLIAYWESKYDAVSYSLNSTNSSALQYLQQIEDIRGVYAIASYFTDEEQSELNNYIFEGDYTDEYVTITDNMTYSEKFEQMQTLYDRAVMRLARVSSPTQEFEVDTENFIFASEFAEWSEQLETGCLINVELEQDDLALLFLSNITINYEDKSLKLTFGNRFSKFDNKSLFDDMLGDISKSANTLSYLKEVLYPIKNGGWDSMKEALSKSRNITMGAALASTNEEVVIDEAGYTGRKRLPEGGFDQHQIKITGRSIVFTNDSWDSCKTAIGELVIVTEKNGETVAQTVYGINAEAIIGDVIVGERLKIYGSDKQEILSVDGVNGAISTAISKNNKDIEETYATITQTDEAIEAAIGKVDHVKHEKDGKVYRFDSEGLYISGTKSDMVNKLDESGMVVSARVENTVTPVLTVVSSGVTAANLKAEQYLCAGENARFEDYYDGNGNKVRSACFYVGG